MPWLDTRNAAGHLDISESRFLSLVKSRKLPHPSYHLGDRSPRWRSEALDRAMEPNSAFDVTQGAVDGLVKKIEEKGRTSRQANAG